MLDHPVNKIFFLSCKIKLSSNQFGVFIEWHQLQTLLSINSVNKHKSKRKLKNRRKEKYCNYSEELFSIHSLT